MTRDNTHDATETVFVDPLTELYHRDVRHAGDRPLPGVASAEGGD